MDYVLFTNVDRERLEVAVDALWSATELRVLRNSKKGEQEIDARPMLRHISVREDGAVELGVHDFEGRAGKAKDYIKLLGLELREVRVLRKDVYTGDDRRSFGDGLLAL